MTQALPAMRTTPGDLAEGVLDAIVDGVVTTDRDWRILSINRAALAMDGRPAEAILGRTLWEAWPAHVGTPVEAACRRAMETGVPVEITHRQAGDARETWLDIRAHPLAGGLALLYRDVGARRRDEQRLRESEERFRLAVAAFEGAIHEYDPVADHSTRIGAFEKIIGFAPEEMAASIGFWLDRVHPDDLDRFRAALATIHHGDADRFEVEYRVRHRDGHWVHCWQRSLAVRDADRRLVKVVGSIVDVSARKAADAALRESEERFRTFAEHAPDAIYIVDAVARRLEYLSPAYERIWGEARAPVMHDLGRWAALMHPEDRERALAAIPGLYERGEAVDAEYRILRADGTIRHIRDTAVPIRDAAGRVVRVIGIAHDATARKLAEQHRELLIRELNHRVKNTLATVQSIAAQTLREGCEPAVRDAFTERLISLAGAHDLLTRRNWEGAELREVAEQALAPHIAPERVVMDGPALRLTPKAALAIGMALHELATNAAKYGALSVPEGRVRLGWTARQAGLRLDWREAGGPPVHPPARRGFGTRLLERGLPHELQGRLRLDFAPEGLHCEVEAPPGVLLPQPWEMG